MPPTGPKPLPDLRPSRRTVLGAVAATAAASTVPLLTATAAQAHPRNELFYVGSWNGAQLTAAWFDAARGTVTAIGPVADVVSNWATAHPERPVLYVAGGEDGGIVRTFAVDRSSGALTAAGVVHTDVGGTAGGGLSCLGVDRPSNTLLVANFEAGLAAALPIAADGTLGPTPSVVADTGSGPNPRQLGPHVHDVTVDPSGRFALVADFGAARVFVRRFDRTTRTLSADGVPGPGQYATAPGSGPRRVLFHPGGRTAYLLTELTAELHTLHWDARTALLTQRQTLSIDPSDFTGTRSGAELALSGDGRFLYASSRGTDTLSVYSTAPGTGLLSLVQRTPCGGVKPWSFTLHPGGRWLSVANETPTRTSRSI